MVYNVLLVKQIAKNPSPSIRLQFNKQGELRHFLCIEDIPRDLLKRLFDTATSFIQEENSVVKKVPLLRAKTVANLFFESSTRTRSTFELAAKRLSADVINLNTSVAAVQKGESLLDTLKSLEAMNVDIFVIRHSDSGAAQFIAQHIKKGAAVINAGDGSHAHPTQALLDMYTIMQHKPDLSALSVAIIGDIRHSRVARSQISILKTMGVKKIHLIGPTTLLPPFAEKLDGQVFHSVEEGIAGADVIIVLRLQKERMQGGFLPSMNEYYHSYGMTIERLKLAAPDAIVMHPGPINRGVEISSLVADGYQSVILEQVTYGIAIRMAVMSHVASGQMQEALR